MLGTDLSLRPWSTSEKPSKARLALTFGSSVVLIGYVLFAAFRSVPDVEPGVLPVAGFTVSDIAAAWLPQGGTFLAVSDYCDTCRHRAPSYLSHVTDRGGTILVVEVDEARPHFSPMIATRDGLAGKVLYTRRGGVRNLIGARVVPAFVEVDAGGLVISAGISNIGWYRKLDPTQWLSAWNRVLRRDSD